MSLDTLSSVTYREILPYVVDQVLLSNPTLALMFQNTVFLDGGTHISQPIVVNKNSTPASYSGADPLNMSFDDELTSFEFNWAQYYATIAYTGLDDLRNGGENAVANLLKIRSQIAEYSLRETMGTDLQGDGTGNNSKAMTGLAAAIDDSTNVATYGNVSRTTVTAVRSQYSANGGVARALTVPLLLTNYQNCSKDNDRPTHHITTPGMFAKYVGLLTPTIRTGDDATANMGHPNVLFMQRPVIADDQVTSTPRHFWWMINMRHWTFYVHRARNFMFVPFARVTGQDVALAHILFAGQPICDKPASQGQIRDLSPTA